MQILKWISFSWSWLMMWMDFQGEPSLVAELHETGQHLWSRELARGFTR